MNTSVITGHDSLWAVRGIISWNMRASKAVDSLLPVVGPFQSSSPR
jgi:hypothetical protein